MKTGITVHDVDPASIVVAARQFPASGPFGLVEVNVGEFSVTFFAQGKEAAKALLTSLRTAAAIEIDVRP